MTYPAGALQVAHAPNQLRMQPGRLDVVDDFSRRPVTNLAERIPHKFPRPEVLPALSAVKPEPLRLMDVMPVGLVLDFVLCAVALPLRLEQLRAAWMLAGPR